MKKGCRRVLLIFLLTILALIALFVLFLVGYRLFGPKPTHFLTEEECAERVVGTWEEPFGVYSNLVFNADGTGDLGGVPVTWEVGERYNAFPGDDYCWFVVNCHTEGSDDLYIINFYYEEKIDYTYTTTYTVWDEKHTEIRLEEKDLYNDSGLDTVGKALRRYRTETVEVVALDETNWNDYFTIEPADDWIEYPGHLEWRFSNYVALKEEYRDRLLTEGNNDFIFSCCYDVSTTPYYLVVDEKNRSVTLGEQYTGTEGKQHSFAIEEEPFSTLNHVDGLGYTLGPVGVPDENIPSGENVRHIITDYTVKYAEGVLLLAIPGPSRTVAE